MVKQCQRCGKDFTAKRSDALYCSSTCKVAAHREGRKSFMQEHETADPEFTRAAVAYFKQARKALDAWKALSKAAGVSVSARSFDHALHALELGPLGSMASGSADPRSRLMTALKQQYLRSL